MNTTAVKLTVAGKSVEGTDCEPCHSAWSSGKKPAGCLGCSLLPTVCGVQIGSDYKGAPAKKVQEARPTIRHHRMSGYGPRDAKILFVLTTPTRGEDASGNAMTCAEANFLRTGMQNASMDPAVGVRFTYAVRCSVAKVTDTMIRSCNTYLAREIERVDPDIIVPVGANPLKAVAGPHFTISSAHGRPFHADVCGRKRTIMPMLSYGSVCADDTLAAAAQKAFNRLAKLVEGKFEVQAGLGKYTRVETAEHAAELLNKIQSGDVAVDIETNTLSPRDTRVTRYQHVRMKSGNIKAVPREDKFHTAKIVSVSWTTRTGEAYYVVRDHKHGTWDADDRAVFDEAFANLLRRKSVRKLIWNAMFEQTWFKVHYKTLAVNFLDVMVLHYVRNERAGHALDEVAQEYTGMGVWTQRIMPFQKKYGYNFWYIPLDALGEYGGADVDATLRIARILEAKRLNPKRRRLAYTFYPELIDSLSEMQAIGASGDLDAAKLFERYTRILSDQAYNRVIDIPQVRRFIRHRRREDPKRGKRGEWRFKLSSPLQLKKILFGKRYMARTPFAYGDPPPGKKVGSPKTDKESLNYFVKTHDCAFSKALLEWRKNEKRHSTYAMVALSQMNSFGGYLHGCFRPTGTVTGRLSSNAINLQNVPQVARRIYVSRFGDEGCVVGLDYSQIEVRVAACLSNDPLLLEVYARGEDVHTATMCRMFGYTAEEAAVMEKEDPAKFKRLRTIAKRVVFGVIYGIGPDGIVRTCRGEGITVTEDEAAQYIDKFFEVYAGLADWIADTVNYLEEHGRVVSPFGRVRHLPEIWSDTSTDEGRKRRSRARRQGPNAIIQGTASDFTTTAIILIRREMKKRKLRSKLMLTVHDSIMFDCVRSEVAEVVTLAKHIMENLPKLAATVWGDDFDWSWVQCPIVAEPEIGLNWRDQVKYDPSGENKKAFRSVDEALKAAKELQDKEDEVMVRTLAEMKHAA